MQLSSKSAQTDEKMFIYLKRIQKYDLMHVSAHVICPYAPYADYADDADLENSFEHAY